ncbi:energy-coupling factor transporter ATPase [Mycoplasmoides genitalium]|uniref:energy-coupling factor transporter ATPase n=1 Tax=Mycoplasmoides genitalium TaxID=2097 RepID=UPI00027B3AA9|nr:energy-coupling factor transporter ATPase [Mycoplasmoides genitalium]AFQ03003.1 cobalt transporter ATP-binding subunit [Mycoplasmoides genitalium M2321]AFQ03491.1 cobalt transporter ATP-binding subunit [Mycoplasmoides genitalium M6282]
MLPTKQAACSFINVAFSYNELPLIRELSFSVYEGEYVCIVGHNGSGKSTISKLLTGLLKPQAGEIKIFGKTVDFDNVSYLRNNIGIIFQNPDNQFIGITVEDDIAFGLENKCFSRQKIKAIIDEVTLQTQTDGFIKQEPHNLSGGQKQRVAIASVLALNPAIIIFDESTAMLDPKAKKTIKQFMVKLAKQGKCVISITHDMEEVTKADKVLVMNEGKLIKQGKPVEVFTSEQELQKIRLDIPFSLSLSTKIKGITSTIDYQTLIKSIAKLWKKR